MPGSDRAPGPALRTRAVRWLDAALRSLGHRPAPKCPGVLADRRLGGAARFPGRWSSQDGSAPHSEAARLGGAARSPGRRPSQNGSGVGVRAVRKLGGAARSLGYLAGGLPVGVAALGWLVVSVVLVSLLSVSQLGPHAFVGATALARALARLERRRVGWLGRRALADPYPPAVARGIRARARELVARPTTWRDAAWLALLFPLAVTCLVPALAVSAVTVGLATAPAWMWAVPNPTAPRPVVPLVSTWPGHCVASLVGLSALPAACWLVGRLAAGQGRLAALLLAAGPRQRLAERAQRLATSRAGVIDAQAAELVRIERDLHDGAQARIVAAGMTLALADRKLRGGATATDDIRLARRQLDDALTDMRRLVRGIHPPILTDRGLRDALSALAADSPLRVEVHADRGARPVPAIESAAYFVVAEALTNAAKHAEARRCLVELAATGPGGLAVRVTDDGRGGADPGGPGLDGLRRRVEALDGDLSVTSPPGGPTTVLAEFPCAS